MATKTRRTLLALTILIHLAGCAEGLFEPARPVTRPAPVAPPPAPPLPEYRGPATRSFLMGFTRWPADLTREGVAIAADYAYAHGDIVSVTFIGGIPGPRRWTASPIPKMCRRI